MQFGEYASATSTTSEVLLRLVISIGIYALDHPKSTVRLRKKYASTFGSLGFKHSGKIKSDWNEMALYV